MSAFGTVVLPPPAPTAEELGLGTAALLDAGTDPDDVPQLDAGGLVPRELVEGAVPEGGDDGQVLTADGEGGTAWTTVGGARAASTLPLPVLADWTDANTIGWADTAANTTENGDGIYLQAPDAARTGTVGIALDSLGAGPWAVAFDFGQNDSGNGSEHRLGIGLYDPVAGRLGAVAWSQVGNATLYLVAIDDSTSVWDGSTLAGGSGLTEPQISTSVRAYLALDASNNLTLYYADGAGIPRVAEALAGAFDDTSRIVFFHNVAGSYAVADGIEGLLAGMQVLDSVPGFRG